MEQRLKELDEHLSQMKQRYQKRGIPLSYYKDSIRDVQFRLDRYEKQHGIKGLSEWDLFWLKDVFEAKFFDIGVLRFQIFMMDHALIERSDYDYMPLSTNLKQRFPEGQYYINIHIVQGADLDPKKVMSSLDEARHFFKTYFSDYDFEYFLCRTWLLDESLELILSPESKILKFRGQFEILTRNFHKGHPLLRIYGTDDLDVISQMEFTTSLQKQAYRHADALGVSWGCIPF